MSAEFVSDWRVEVRYYYLYEALAAHPRIAPMYPEPHTHGETHVWSPPQGTNIMRHDGENTLRALRRALPTEKVASEEGFGWEMEVRELKRWSLLCLGVHAALPRARRSARQDLLVSPIRQCKLYECEVHRHAPGPRETSLLQYVMKTHMRVALYNDRENVLEGGHRRHEAYGGLFKVLGRCSGFINKRVERTRGGLDASGKNRRPSFRKVRPHQLPREPLPGLRVEVGLLLSVITMVRALPFARYVDVLEHLMMRRYKEWWRGSNSPTSARTATKIRRRSSHWRAPKRNVARDGGVSALSEEHAAALDDFFRPMNRKLDLLLGRPTGYPATAQSRRRRLLDGVASDGLVPEKPSVGLNAIEQTKARNSS